MLATTRLLLALMSAFIWTITKLMTVHGTEQAAEISRNWLEGRCYKHVSGPFRDWSRVVGELSVVKLRADIGSVQRLLSKLTHSGHIIAVISLRSKLLLNSGPFGQTHSTTPNSATTCLVDSQYTPLAIDFCGIGFMIRECRLSKPRKIRPLINTLLIAICTAYSSRRTPRHNREKLW